MLTINQSLDLIFVSYKNKNIKTFPAVQKLKEDLFQLKQKHGGNTQVDNEDTVRNVVKFGTANPDDWK